MWMELVGLGDEMVQASFQREYGPDNWIEQYRIWEERQNEEKDRRMLSMLQRLAMAETRIG
jgi:hypothetical protein